MKLVIRKVATVANQILRTRWRLAGANSHNLPLGILIIASLLHFSLHLTGRCTM
jgi:hypothetical protein